MSTLVELYFDCLYHLNDQVVGSPEGMHKNSMGCPGRISVVICVRLTVKTETENNFVEKTWVDKNRYRKPKQDDGSTRNIVG